MHFYKDWMEFFFLALAVAGIAIALFVPSAAISYATIFVSGLFAGRVIYERKGKIQFPFFVIISGFLIGYLIGNYYGSRKLLVVIFIAGAVASYCLYDNNIIKDTRF